jgi:hypothetical protein
VIGTFGRPEDGEAFAEAIRQLARIVRSATVGANGESYHGHLLVVAWVRDEDEQAARRMVAESGGLLHEPPFGARPPD